MPLSDLSMIGLAILSAFGLLVTFIILPSNFLDTIIFFYYKIHLNEDPL